MNYPKTSKLPYNYDPERLNDFKIPEILIIRGKKYKLVKKLKYLYLYKKDIRRSNNELYTLYECFSEFDIKVIEYYKGKVEI